MPDSSEVSASAKAACLELFTGRRLGAAYTYDVLWPTAAAWSTLAGEPKYAVCVVSRADARPMTGEL